MDRRKNQYISRQMVLSPAYEYARSASAFGGEYGYGHTPLPIIPVAAHPPINIHEKYSYYILPTPIDRAYQISRATNCMGPAPRLPGLLPCPYGTDAIACAHHAA